MQTGKSQEVQIEGSHFTIVEVHTTQAKFYTAAVPHDVPLRVVGGGCGVAVVGGGMCWCIVRMVWQYSLYQTCGECWRESRLSERHEYCAHGVAISDMWRMPEMSREPFVRKT